MSPDFFNGMFELVGAYMLTVNVRALHKSKRVAGVHWAPTLFFTSWGGWNLFYYPHLDQWFSFAAGALLVAVNAVWFGQMVYYRQSRQSRVR